MSFFNDEWCEYTNDIRIIAGAGQDIVVEQEVTHFDGRAVANKPQQQPEALNFSYGPNNALLANLCFALANVPQEMFRFDGFDNGDNGRRGERTPAERGAQITGPETTCYVIGAQYCATGSAATQRFGARENVRLDPECLHGEKLAGASDA